MRISIAMATYNGAKYLQEQLDSFICQTCQPDELVVCDDGSTDATLKILEIFIQKAPFTVRIYHNKSNMGFIKNFEKALLLCTGNIILLCDQDDIWKPSRVEKSADIFKKNPECGYLFSDACLIDSNNQSLPDTLWSKVKFTSGRQHDFCNHESQPIVLYQKNCVTGATLALRAEHLRLLLPFPLLDGIIHDGWIAMVLSLHGHFGIALSEHLISYRIHAQQQAGIREKNIYQRVKLRLISHRKNIQHRLFELRTIHAQVLLSSSSAALQRFDYTFGLLLGSLEFRSRILTIPKRNARITLVCRHLFSGGYKGNPSPLLSALKDLIY